MISITYGNYIYLAVLIFTFICVVYRYKILDDASKIFSAYVIFSIANEYLAYVVARIFHNNMPVYAIYSLIEFALISLYFNGIVDVFRHNKIGYYIGGIGIILGIINIVFIQGIYALNSYFLVFEGICIIGMALFFFFRLLLKHDQLRLDKYHHFWFATILVFFWSITFLNWSLYDYFLTRYSGKMWIISASILGVDVITYLAISTVFILYPKMQRGDD